MVTTTVTETAVLSQAPFPPPQSLPELQRTVIGTFDWSPCTNLFLHHLLFHISPTISPTNIAIPMVQ
eukprot:15367209-Ditylum_brightwellii.AAC.1